MHRTPTSRIPLLLIAALLLPLLVACGDDDGNDNADTSLAPTETAAVPEAGTPTEPPNDNAESTVPAGFVVVTAESDEPVVKDVPEGPAPTAIPPPPSDFDEDGDGFYTADELTTAIRALFPTYDWPEKYHITVDIIIDGMDFGSWPDSKWEAPGEYTIIGGYNDCAWQLALLDAVREDNTDQIDTALYQLKDIGLTKNPMSHDEEGKQMMRDMYDRAALGDPADLQQWVDNNCGFEKEAFITPGTPVAATSHLDTGDIAR